MPRSKKTNRDYAQRQQRPRMEDEVIAAQISALVTPALVAQEKYFRSLGMRVRHGSPATYRILNLGRLGKVDNGIVTVNIYGIKYGFRQCKSELEWSDFHLTKYADIATPFPFKEYRKGYNYERREEK
jgi:hypothetical protein